MSSHIGTANSRYVEIVETLKEDLRSHMANPMSSDHWERAEKLYHALRSMEDLTDAHKTTLEELVGFIAPAALATAKHAEKIAVLALGEQQEPEAATEIERGA